jgi:hypothetical protein
LLRVWKHILYSVIIYDTAALKYVESLPKSKMNMGGMSEEFNMDDLEKDDELQNELRLLGWCDDEPQSRDQRKPSVRKIKPKPSETSAHVEVTRGFSYSVGDIGKDDGKDVEFTDEDMMDPDLLSELQTLHISDDHHDAKSLYRDADSVKKDECSEESEDESGDPRIPDSVDMKRNSNSALKTNHTSIGNSDASEKMTSAEAKSRALACHKEGNKAEALKWMKMSKALEQDSIGTVKKLTKKTNSEKAIMPSKESSPKVIDVSSSNNIKATRSPDARESTPGDRFTHLENALNAAMKDSLKEAQLLLPTDRTASANKLKNYKRYQQDMNVLASRRGLPGAEPAPFKWMSIEKDTIVENLDIGDDQLVLVIEVVSGLEMSLVGQTSRTITVTYDLGLPKEAPITGKINGKVDANGCAVLKFQSCLPIVKRNRTMQTNIRKTKATFEVALTRGVFFSNVDLGTASLSLVDLNTKCECGGILPLEKSSSSSTGKKITACSAGSMTVFVKMRKPVAAPEIVKSVERTLVLEGWPSLGHVYRSPTAAASVGSSSHNDQKDSEEPHQDELNLHPAGLVNATRAKVPSSQPKANADFAILSEREKSDPCSAEFLESNDVLEAEIASDTAAIREIEGRPASTYSEEEESSLFTMKLRVQLMTTKLNMLVSSVQEEVLTLEQYVDKVKARLGRDRVLAQYLLVVSRQEEPPEGTSHYLASLTKRINIMQKEIATVESAT